MKLLFLMTFTSPQDESNAMPGKATILANLQLKELMLKLHQWGQWNN
jgi:hypothetical protein